MSTFKIRTTALRELLTRVIPFACADTLLPQINVIEWRSDGKSLILTATDRYTIGRVTHPSGEDDEQIDPFEPFSMKLTDAKRILALFKAARNIGMPARLTIETTSDSVVVSDGALSFTAKHAESKFVSVAGIFRPLLEHVDKGTLDSPIGFDPRLLARFNVLNVPAVFWPAPANKPWLVTVDEHFSGVIMPVRITDRYSSDTTHPHTEHLASLRAQFAEPKPGPIKPARKPRAKKVKVA